MNFQLAIMDSHLIWDRTYTGPAPTIWAKTGLNPQIVAFRDINGHHLEHYLGNRAGPH